MRGAVYVFNITNFASHWVWTVATIDWPSATVTPVGTLYDCTANWSGGCLAAIPWAEDGAKRCFGAATGSSVG